MCLFMNWEFHLEQTFGSSLLGRLSIEPVTPHDCLVQNYLVYTLINIFWWSKKISEWLISLNNGSSKASHSRWSMLLLNIHKREHSKNGEPGLRETGTQYDYEGNSLSVRCTSMGLFYSEGSLRTLLRPSIRS
jgi:hypothetical protein